MSELIRKKLFIWILLSGDISNPESAERTVLSDLKNI